MAAISSSWRCLPPAPAPPPQGSASSGRGDFALSINGAREDFNGFLLDGVYNVDPEAEHAGVRPPVDGDRPVPGADLHLRCLLRPQRRRADQRDHQVGRQSTRQARRTSSCETADSMRATTSRRRTSRRPTTAATSSAVRSADHSCGITRSSLRTTSGRICVKASRGSRTFQRLRSGTGDFSQTLFNRPINFLTGQPFSGGVIPPPFQSPIGRAIAALYPAPNRATPFANYVSSPTLRDDIDHVDARVDHSMAGGARLTARYSLSDRRLFDPFAGPGFALVPGFGTECPGEARTPRSRSPTRPPPGWSMILRFG